MHGVMGKPPGAAQDNNIATSKVMLLMLVVMTGVAPISLYMLVPALPVLATDFGRDISIAQMTVSLYMVGIALSQLIMGPLSDKFGRRPVLLAGLGLMVVAGIGSVFAETLPQLIAARFFQGVTNLMCPLPIPTDAGVDHDLESLRKATIESGKKMGARLQRLVSLHERLPQNEVARVWIRVGMKIDESERMYLHRGIASRQFARSFVLADGIEITAAELDNGLLHIDLMRPSVESRVQTIEINADKKPDRKSKAVDVETS